MVSSLCDRVHLYFDFKIIIIIIIKSSDDQKYQFIEVHGTKYQNYLFRATSETV